MIYGKKEFFSQAITVAIYKKQVHSCLKSNYWMLKMEENFELEKKKILFQKMEAGEK